MPDQPQQFTQRARRVLKLAQEEAERQHLSEINAEHLLLGLMREEEQEHFLQELGREVKRVQESDEQETRLEQRPTIGLLILDENEKVVISNEPAHDIIDNHWAELLDAISRSTGSVAEIDTGLTTYLTTSARLSDASTIIIIQDITHVKKLERDIEAFAVFLVHDLGIPIHAIRGMAELLPEHGHLDETGQQFVGHIIQAADRMSEMLNQLVLSLREIDASKIARQPCDLKKLVDEAMAHVHTVASNKSVRLKFDFPADGCEVWGDENLLHDMVRSLVDNAVQYSHNGKEVNIALTRDMIGIHLSVQDQGTVIPEDVMPHIFDKYDISGGMWLWSVKAIAEAHGGTVEAKDIPGGGIEVAMLLPASMALPPDA